jgi:GTP cyclohydrolase I
MTDPNLRADAHAAVRTLLEYIGEDWEREGLQGTPERVVKAWDEMTKGYKEEPEKILVRDFDAGGYDQIIGCNWIEFYSTCEHHLLPFSGSAHIAYLPSKIEPRVVGLSKLARLVDCYARRLQIQEQMTMQIAMAMEKHLDPQGVAVVVQARHLCMACRGVQKHQAVMVTSAMRGVFREEGPARAEFFRLVELSRPNGR